MMEEMRGLLLIGAEGLGDLREGLRDAYADGVGDAGLRERRCGFRHQEPFEVRGGSERPDLTGDADA